MQGVDNQDKVKTVQSEGQDMCVCSLEYKGQRVKSVPQGTPFCCVCVGCVVCVLTRA